jgi:hypothetical protein
MENRLRLTYFVPKEQEGQYLTLPFQMPPDTEGFSLRYEYERHAYSRSSQGENQKEKFTSRQEINIIDLALLDGRGRQVGASGSDKTEIEISATSATPGYQRHSLEAGEWRIVIGVYKVASEGVRIAYELAFTPKKPRWLKGDLHTHTLASDGVLTAAELAQRARRHGLDFLAITDHNQMSTSESLPQIPGITLIPGVEWTHFQGHANFLGVDRPYDEPFYANDCETVKDRFRSAQERGALVTINHPFEEICPFRFDIQSLPFDCLEVWNGPMRESNLRALGLWQQLLQAGRKLPACGGSDYHRDQLFLYPGGPATCVYAPSASAVDILESLRQGHAYIVYAPDGPSLEVRAGKGGMGDSVPFAEVREMEVEVDGLLAGDLVQVVTGEERKPIFQAKADGRFAGNFTMSKAGFARIEVLRSFVPGLPPLPALLGNPVYFDE